MNAEELSVEAAVQQVCASIPVQTHLEIVPLARAHGRVLATNVTSLLDLPAFDNCAMDGYAVRSTDLRPGANTFPVNSVALAGRPAILRVEPTTCVRVMTGAALPAGADAVVTLEDAVSLADGRVQLPGPIAAGQHVRKQAEHVHAGATVLTCGRLLRGPEIGLAASVGHSTVPVFRPLRVGVMSTGDELCDPPALRSETGSYDANRAFLIDASRQLSCEVHDLGICPDDPGQFAVRLDMAAENGLEVVVTTGGAAMGDADVVRRTPGARFLPLNIRPGRGVVFAQHAGSAERPLLLLGLPGNAVAAFVMFHLIVRQVLLFRAGGQAQPLTRFQLPLAESTSAKANRIDWRRGHLTANGAIQLLRDQGSAMLRTVVDADVLAAIGPATTYAKGDRVEAIVLRGATC